MAFKKKEFDQAKFTHRVENVPVLAMKDWFDGARVWKVRGLTGNELGRCQEMAESRKSLTEIIQDILVKKNDESTTDYIPKENALRIEYLMIGSVDPECDQDLAIKINEAYPIEFRILTAKILDLTGQGQTVGKQTPSGETPASEPA